jgi:predicted dehydrogenase
MHNPVNIGIIGTGNIAPAYLRGCGKFDFLNVIACADLDRDRARAFADQYHLTPLSIDALLANPDIDIIINLTVPKAHAEVSLAILEAGKHVYSEKPLAVHTGDGRRILEVARQKGLRVGCAPDTFLGGGLQTGRWVIDQGWIGEPVAASAFMLYRGPDQWHPNPFFFFEKGAGPLFDMGPYYLTALVNLLGSVRQVNASARISFKERIAQHQAVQGAKISVETNTHISATLDFASGVVATMLMSFDVWAHTLPKIEVYGSEGSLSLPDPNTFLGSVQVWRAANKHWQDVPLTHQSDVERGIGVADMVEAMRVDAPHRASGELAFHVLEVMEAIEQAASQQTHLTIQSQVDRPKPLTGNVAANRP